jgi:signal transduction histidine kinase
MHAKQRRIIVHLDASDGMPLAHDGAMRVSEPNPADLLPDSVWVTIGVEDSGKGLTSAELKKLFARFAQANPK